MNEMSVNWRRVGVIVIGLLSLTLVAMLILQLGGERNADRPLVSLTAARASKPVHNPDRLMYENKELGFSLELPQSWEGYKVLSLDSPAYGENIVSISLPVERYKKDLLAPRDLANGVMLVGVRVVSREYVTKEHAFCAGQQALLDRYKKAEETSGTFTSEGNEWDIIYRCLAIYDPEANTPEGAEKQYLGRNGTSYFYLVPLDTFDNGFKKTPEGLTKEITSVYQSFQVW